MLETAAWSKISPSTLSQASLRAKESEPTFDDDPLFGKTSRLFDENSAAGETGGDQSVGRCPEGDPIVTSLLDQMFPPSRLPFKACSPPRV